MRNKIIIGIMAVITVLLELFSKFELFPGADIIGKTLVPIIFIGSFVLLVLDFKTDKTFNSKWAWVAVFVLEILVLDYFASFVYNILSKEFIFGITELVYAAGFAVLFIAFLKQPLWKFSKFGFGALILGGILKVVLGFGSINTVVPTLMLVGLLIISMDILKKIHKPLRWVIIVLGLISIFVVGFFSVSNTVIFGIITAILLVPIGKFKVSFERVIAVMFIVLAIVSLVMSYVNSEYGYVASTQGVIQELESEIAEIEAKIDEYQQKIDSGEKGYYITEYEYSYSYWSGYRSYPVEKFYSWQSHIDELLPDIAQKESEIANFYKDIVNGYVSLAAGLISAAGLICLAIVFFKKKYGGILSLISCGLVVIGTAMSMFMCGYIRAYWSFDLINYPIIIFGMYFGFYSILSQCSLLAIMFNIEKRPVKLRVLVIALSVVMAYVGTLVSPEYTGIFAFYAIAMIFAAILLVPFKFTEYNGIGKHLFFNIITIGIWNLIWVYHVTKNLNKVNGVVERKARIELLLYLFLPFYSVYWYYKTAEYVDAYAVQNGKESKLAVLSLVFGLICPLVPYVVIQDKINQIVGKPEKTLVIE